MVSQRVINLIAYLLNEKKKVFLHDATVQLIGYTLFHFSIDSNNLLCCKDVFNLVFSTVEVSLQINS